MKPNPLPNDLILVSGKVYLVFAILHQADGRQKLVCFRNGVRTNFMLEELPEKCVVERVDRSKW